MNNGHISKNLFLKQIITNEFTLNQTVLNESYSVNLQTKPDIMLESKSLQYNCELCEFQSEEQNTLKDHLLKIHYNNDYIIKTIDSQQTNLESLHEIERKYMMEQKVTNYINMTEDNSIKDSTTFRVAIETRHQEFRKSFSMASSYKPNAMDRKETNEKILDI